MSTTDDPTDPTAPSAASAGPASASPAAAGTDTTDSSSGVDGRVRRGERTRAAIVAALLDLLTSGEVEPTSQRIADEAGVSVRSIFQHFADLEELYGALAQAQAERTRGLFEALATEGDLPERIARLVTQRSTLYEAITPVRHAIGSRAKHSPALAQRLEHVDSLLRGQLERHFDEELGREDADTAGQLLESLDLLWSFEAWDRVRTAQSLSVEQASGALTQATRRLLRRADDPA